MLTKEDLQAIQNLLEPIKQDLSEVKESLAEVREATNYIAEWVEAVESKVDSVRNRFPGILLCNYESFCSCVPLIICSVSYPSFSVMRAVLGMV